MERLSFIDQVMHRAGTSGLVSLDMQGAIVLDPSRANGPRVTARELAEHIATRLAEVPILRKRLVQDALHLGDLRLVDDPDFDVRRHVVRSSLPKPGNHAQLMRALGRFSAEQLDPGRPLWRFEVIDGLADGRIAIVQKLSHATMDGVAAMKVMQALLDAQPTRPQRGGSRSSRREARPLPSAAWLLASAGIESVDRYLLKAPRLAARTATAVARQGLDRALHRADRDGGTATPKRPATRAFGVRRTSLNTAISLDRRNLAFTTFAVSGLKEVARALDCTINDLCLLLVSEALLRYFRGVGESIAFDLKAAIPINVRGEGDRAAGNALAYALVNLHNTERPLRARLRAIQAETTRAKERSGRSGRANSSLLGDLGQIVPPVAIELTAGLLKRMQPWNRIPIAMNVIMSNVAGPRETPYVAGMPVALQIPMVPILPTCALATSAVSMGDQLTLGFHACGQVVDEKHMHLLVEGAQIAFRSLVRAAKRSTPRAESA